MKVFKLFVKNYDWGCEFFFKFIFNKSNFAVPEYFYNLDPVIYSFLENSVFILKFKKYINSSGLCLKSFVIRCISIKNVKH